MVVLVTWTVAPSDVDEFLRTMAAVRRYRLRSGALRWRLYHDPDQPEQLTELFEVPDWDEHLRQGARLDDASAAALRRAWELDRNGEPSVRHLVGLRTPVSVSRRDLAQVAGEFRAGRPGS